MTWMAWTLPTAIFFVCIAVVLFVMTLLELRYPTVRRRGWLPIATTRGDRLFITLLGAAFIHMVVIGVAGSYVAGATLAAAIWAVLIMRWG